MAFSRKGWRRIVVGGQVFYWQTEDIPWQGEQHWAICHARPETEPHRLLTVTNARCNRACEFSDIVSPRIVRACIESAVTTGWLAERPNLRLLLFSNPLRCVTLQPSWLTSTVLAIATGFYQEGVFDRLPVLADALEEAGCTNADILNHCRGPGPHVGCWAVDLILRKT